MKSSKAPALALLPLVSLLGSTSPVAASQPNFVTLQPGQFQQIDQNLQVNIVLVGYHPGSGPRDIQESDFRSVVPQTYRSINRDPRYYGLDSPTGVRFSYNYNIVYANSTFENAYFSYLNSISVASPITLFQDQYNHQNARTLTVNQKAHGSSYMFTDDFTQGRRH